MTDPLPERDEDGLWVPPDEMKFSLDRSDMAHLISDHFRSEHSAWFRTRCGHARFPLLFTYSEQPWGLLNNPQYRAWPPKLCQDCIEAYMENR